MCLNRTFRLETHGLTNLPLSVSEPFASHPSHLTSHLVVDFTMTSPGTIYAYEIVDNNVVLQTTLRLVPNQKSNLEIWNQRQLAIMPLNLIIMIFGMSTGFATILVPC